MGKRKGMISRVDDAIRAVRRKEFSTDLGVGLAAIAEIRNPTEAMIAAGNEAILEGKNADHVWRMMFAEAVRLSNDP